MELECLKIAGNLIFLAKSNRFLMWLSDEVLCILIAYGAAKLSEVKVGGAKRNPGLKPQATLEWCRSGSVAEFFQTSYFDNWQFCCLFSYKDV